MIAAIAATWALLLGMALWMIGNGLQASLVGLRATLEGFSTTTTGLVMSGYYIGFMLGSILTPPALRRVGHVRVFAALAALVLGGMAVFALCAQVFGAARLGELRQMRRR